VIVPQPVLSFDSAGVFDLAGPDLFPRGFTIGRPFDSVGGHKGNKKGRMLSFCAWNKYRPFSNENMSEHKRRVDVWEDDEDASRPLKR
jgi:hypothetical protein